MILPNVDLPGRGSRHIADLLLEPTHMRPHLIDTAWDSLSVETQIDVLVRLVEEQRWRCELPESTLRKMLSSRHPLVRYYAAQLLSRSNNSALRELLDNDPSPFVRGVLAAGTWNALQRPLGAARITVMEAVECIAFVEHSTWEGNSFAEFIGRVIVDEHVDDAKTHLLVRAYMEKHGAQLRRDHVGDATAGAAILDLIPHVTVDTGVLIAKEMPVDILAATGNDPSKFREYPRRVQLEILWRDELGIFNVRLAILKAADAGRELRQAAAHVFAPTDDDLRAILRLGARPVASIAVCGVFRPHHCLALKEWLRQEPFANQLAAESAFEGDLELNWQAWKWLADYPLNREHNLRAMQCFVLAQDMLRDTRVDSDDKRSWPSDLMECVEGDDLLVTASKLLGSPRCGKEWLPALRRCLPSPPSEAERRKYLHDRGLGPLMTYAEDSRVRDLGRIFSPELPIQSVRNSLSVPRLLAATRNQGWQLSVIVLVAVVCAVGAMLRDESGAAMVSAAVACYMLWMRRKVRRDEKCLSTSPSARPRVPWGDSSEQYYEWLAGELIVLDETARELALLRRTVPRR